MHKRVLFQLYIIILACLFSINTNAQIERKPAGQTFYINLNPNAIQSIMIKQSQPKFSLLLDANPTTGYSWYLESYNRQLITPIKQYYKANQRTKGLVGSGGQEVWDFLLSTSAFKVPHLIELKLRYLRPFSIKGDEKEIKVFITTYQDL